MEIFNAKNKKLEEVVDFIVSQLGANIVLGAPLGIGKPNELLNSLYQRVKETPELSLTICTGLSLRPPKAQSPLEQRFLGPLVERLFGDYEILLYEEDRLMGKLPENIQVIEFYFPPGKYLRNNYSQQNYISSNYTHVCRDMMDRGVNLLVQMVAKRDDQLSFSCNADISRDMVTMMKSKKDKTLLIGQVNDQLPFMYGDALIEEKEFDIVIDNKEFYGPLFGPPKLKVSSQDHMIGLYASRLVKDDGELQIGIGSLGDAIIDGLIIRQNENSEYQKMMEDLQVEERFSDITKRIGEKGVFEKGLFAATEMLVDGYKELYQANVLKKKVYDHIGLQRLINKGTINPEKLTDEIFDILVDEHLMSEVLLKKDCEFLIYWGILKEEALPKIQGHRISDPEVKYYRGDKLRHGHVAHAGFFLGPQSFYSWLRDLKDEERKLFSMKSVLKINQLYGHEEIDRLHRKNARFINTCMMTTLSGAHVSDGLENGKVVSGVGGQYNFVAMAQELPDGHSILTMRATRKSKNKVVSNIVYNYGHITIPRHLRDILVTEYGIAFLRGKTDSEIIKELLKVCDSRFQEELLARAKKNGKIESSYIVPKLYKNNYPHVYEKFLSNYQKKGFFQDFPFGSELTDIELTLARALSAIKVKMKGGVVVQIKTILEGISCQVEEKHQSFIKRLDLDVPQSWRDRLFRRLVCRELNSIL